MSSEEKSGVEKLKRELYSRKDDVSLPGSERTTLSPSEAEAPRAWQEPVQESAVQPSPLPPSTPGLVLPPPSSRHMSIAKKFLFASAAFFFIALGVAAFMMLGGVNTISPQNIDVEIVAPSIIDGGKETTFQFIITNRNQADLDLADLILDFPEGTRDAQDPTEELSHERVSIGTIKSGEQVKRTAAAIVYGQEGLPQTLRATLEYNVAGSNAVFQKQAEITFTVGSSPVSINVDSPAEVTTGNEFALKVTVRSNATAPVENVVLQGQYPFGFYVDSTNPQAGAGGTFWRLGTLAPGSSRTVEVRGTLEGQDGDERVFRFLAGSNSDQTDTKIKVPFLIMPQTITVHQPFLTGSIAIGGKTGKTIAVPAGEMVQGTVNWKNNLSEPISNVELVLSLSGSPLDKSSIRASTGFYQSSDTSIIWTKDQNNALATVQPGESGNLSFSFKTLEPGAAGVLITNPIINFTLSVRGTRQGSGSSPETVTGAATAQAQLASQVTLETQTLHYSGGFQNIGPMPPQPDVATSYTIVWKVKNSANTVANATVSTTLPPYVQFMSSPGGSGITYDQGSRTLRWSIGDIKPGAGYTVASPHTAFQVTIVPSTSQVGTAPQLTTPPTLIGQDRFTQTEVRDTGEAAYTRLVGEGGAGSNGIVAPKQ